MAKVHGNQVASAKVEASYDVSSVTRSSCFDVSLSLDLIGYKTMRLRVTV